MGQKDEIPVPSEETRSGPGAGWVDLCSADDLVMDGGTYVVHAGRALALFWIGAERLRAFDDACPHAGASLSAGHVHDGCIICPWHAWGFDVESGRCPDNLAVAVNVYEARVVDGRVWVDLRPTGRNDRVGR